MFRKATPIAICLTMLVLGCEKKQPSERALAQTAKHAPSAPAGMTAVGEGARLFIARTPVTVGQYLAYLKGTGQPTPDHWKGVEAGTPRADQPVTDLTKKEASLCATWFLKRVPTLEEWQEAASVVGKMPYPWTADGASASPAAQVYLVQDWLPGSEGDLQAEQAKANLVQAILAEHLQAIQDLRREVEAMAGPQGTRRADVWNQLKPALFAVLDQEKRLSELRAQRERRADVLEMLNRLAVDKAKLAGLLKVSEPSEAEAEAAVSAYTKRLSDIRTQVQATRDELQKSAAAMQEQVVALTKTLEGAGTRATAEQVQQAEAALAQTSAPITNVGQALTVEKALRSAAQSLKEAGPSLNVPSIEQITSRATDLDKQIRELFLEDPTLAQISAAHGKLDQLSETMDREFRQEPLLLQDLDELVASYAHKKAVEANLDGLKVALEVAPAVPRSGQ